MRVLVVTNLFPDSAAPQRGRFVRDQVEALRGLGVDLELFTFGLGKGAYLPAARRLRGILRRSRFDIVHAHYGLAGWSARLAGASPLIVTFHGTDIRHRVVGPLSRSLARQTDLAAAASRALFEREDGRAGLPRRTRRSAVLPCGPDLGRFRQLPRDESRRQLGLDPGSRFLLFPADPARPAKRHDRAAAVADAVGVELLVGGRIDPERMPLFVNAADAVLVTSDHEGFGLAVLEALACDVPVLSTPVGVAPFAAGDLDGCLVAPFDLERWRSAAATHVESPDPRVPGAGRAAAFSAPRMAERVLAAYRELLGDRG